MEGKIQISKLFIILKNTKIYYQKVSDILLKIIVIIIIIIIIIIIRFGSKCDI